MNSLATLKTLVQMSLLPIRGATHEQRLESFYRNQAGHYDAFRKRLLHGRRELLDAAPLTAGETWCDMGAGTGENLEYVDDRLPQLEQVYLVDLCPSLLKVARQRVASHQWHNVEVVQSDAETFRPSGRLADLVTFSYSLSMIPDWIVALENAWQMLRPGGHIAVVDFYVSRKFPPAHQARHAWLTRTFWPAWFALDNVYLRPDVLPYLTRKFQSLRLDECRGRVPFLWGARVPYFIFLGAKRAEEDGSAMTQK